MGLDRSGVILIEQGAGDDLPRHGRACPGQPIQHGVAPGGPHRLVHDDQRNYTPWVKAESAKWQCPT
jgi:hypothetical protein